MANENKLTTVGQMKSFAEKQDARDDAQDAKIQNHTHPAATTSAAGLMSASDKAKLDGVEAGANKYSLPAATSSTLGGVKTGSNITNSSGTISLTKENVTGALGYTPPTTDTKYTHPSYTAKSSGLYKVTVDSTGHVSGTAAVSKSDITALGIPGSDTTYSAAGSSLGLVKSGGDVTISGGVITVNDDSHNHTIENVDGLQDALNSKEASGAAASALTNAKSYTDTKISELINSAPSTLDTLGEIATAMEENADVVEALESAIGNKSDSGHTHSNYASTVTTTGSGNAITAISQSGNTITATKGSTFLTAHPKISTSTDSTSTGAPSHGGTFTAVDSVTRDSNGHVTKVNTKTVTIPSTAATTSAAGLMSASDKSKLDGIATGANAYTHPSYTAKSSGLYKVTVDASGHVSGATAVTKADITALGIPGSDTNTTYSAMTGATSSAAGTSGLVPAPAAGKQTSFLRGDGTWVVPTNTTYSAATTSAAGLMSAADKSKLDGIATGANKYTHPSYTAKSSGLYKVTVDSSGHVSGATAVAKSDITGLGIPAQDTTYGAATTSAAGLMSASDKSKLDGIATGATKVTVDSALSSSSTNPVQNKVINSALAGKAASTHTHDYLPLSGGNMSGHIYLTGAKESSSTSNTTQLVFGTASNNHVAISSNTNALVINPDTSTTTNQIVLYLDKASLFPSGISANVTGNLTGTASKATADASGNTITSTYVKKADAITGLSVSGKTITYTKGNGTTGTITTQDTNTTYSAATTSAAGLMSAADKTKLDGITSITSAQIKALFAT